MLGPFATTSRLTPIHQMSLAILSRAACASMSTTSTTTKTRDRGDRYGPHGMGPIKAAMHGVEPRHYCETTLLIASSATRHCFYTGEAAPCYAGSGDKIFLGTVGFEQNRNLYSMFGVCVYFLFFFRLLQ